MIYGILKFSLWKYIDIYLIYRDIYYGENKVLM